MVHVCAGGLVTPRCGLWLYLRKLLFSPLFTQASLHCVSPWCPPPLCPPSNAPLLCTPPLSGCTVQQPPFILNVAQEEFWKVIYMALCTGKLENVFVDKFHLPAECLEGLGIWKCAFKCFEVMGVFLSNGRTWALDFTEKFYVFKSGLTCGCDASSICNPSSSEAQGKITRPCLKNIKTDRRN